MRLSNFFKLKLFDGSDKLDYRDINENMGTIDGAVLSREEIAASTNLNGKLPSAAAFKSLNSDLVKKVKGYLINVNGTTDNAGIITVTDTNIGDFSQMPYCVTNYSRELSYPYSVTLNNRTATSISFRIRKMADNSAVGNTEVSFTAIVIGF
ncbi:MAG: hypothetical protein KBS66_07435 [Eubacterium sp.]|nr:hypothetical protein [Candidatus Colimonas fimequi]